jgi:hypothetical protein
MTKLTSQAEIYQDERNFAWGLGAAHHRRGVNAAVTAGRADQFFINDLLGGNKNASRTGWRCNRLQFRD